MKPLPTLQNPAVEALYRDYAEALRQSGFMGDICLDYASRTVQSTDNSIYQRFPQGLLYPAGREDLQRIARLGKEERFRSITFSPRGGGTGTNGQSLGEGFVVDLSRHMNRILEINAQEGWARVQAGVVKDQLNAAVADYGLFFAPDLSTSNRATIGGMINTDASGQGSCRYGKTRHHVLEISAVLADGSEWSSQPMGESQLQDVCSREDRVGEVHRLLDSIAREHRQLIAHTYPPLNRSLTGYDLAHLYTDDGLFDLNSIWCGSEGTLGFVAEAKVKLEVLPRHRALMLLYYDDFISALRHSRALMACAPTAIETVDDIVIDLARGDAFWSQVAPFFREASDALAAVNFVEFSEHDEASLQARIDGCRERLHTEKTEALLGFTLVDEQQSIATLWTMRKRAVGLLGNMAGEKRPVPFVEDSAVPPENLPDYIGEFRKLLEAHGLKYGMFGHADAGVIHVRPALDMREADALSTVKQISDKVFALTQRFGGVLWGEHGKGLRSAYSPQTFGELFPQLQRIKAAFDPHNQMNPGKIAPPSAQQALLPVDGVATRGARDRLIPAHIWSDYPGAVHCNGNGVCFNWDPDQSMCPSWKGTRERKYSPKGRAALMKEWLSRCAEAGVEMPARAQADSLLRWPLRAWASARQARAGDDFSREVYDSMDNCLVCKACTTGCPVQVDVPTFRSYFLQYYFRRYLRPLRHLLIARLEGWLPWFASLPGPYNAFTQPASMRKLASRLLGLDDMPALPRRNLTQLLRGLDVQRADAAHLQSLPAGEKQRSLILVPDVFTRCFEPQLVADACRLLIVLGFRVWLAPYKPNGKPLHVLGFLADFQSRAEAQADVLEGLAQTGVPLVGLEPSMTLTYRNEYRQFLGSRKLPAVHLLQEWLATQSEKLEQQKERFAAGNFRLLPHCSEAALAANSLRDWQGIFDALGSKLRIEQVGCCGMAGTYGHESARLASSRNIYAQSWERKLQAAKDACATGYSCRSQVKRFSRRSLPHPLQLLLRQLQAGEQASHQSQ